MGRVARASGHEVESTEVKEDGPAEALAVSESAGHGLDLLDAGVEGFADSVGRCGNDGVDDAPEVSLDGGGELLHRRESAAIHPADESEPSPLSLGACRR